MEGACFRPRSYRKHARFAAGPGRFERCGYRHFADTAQTADPWEFVSLFRDLRADPWEKPSPPASRTIDCPAIFVGENCQAADFTSVGSWGSGLRPSVTNGP